MNKAIFLRAVFNRELPEVVIKQMVNATAVQPSNRGCAWEGC